MSEKVASARGLAASMLLSLTLAACGGGGGGGSSSGGGGGGGGSVGTLTLTMAQTRLDFLGAVGSAGGAPPAQSIQGTITGTGSGTLYIIISSSAPNVAAVSNVTLGTNSGNAEIVPATPTSVGLGHHTATITIKACINDPACGGNQIAGSPKTVSVNYDVNGITSTTSSLTFDVGNAPVTADLNKAMNIDSFGTAGWVATVNLPMLEFTSTSRAGDGSAPLTAFIDAAKLDDFDSGNYTGEIKFTAPDPNQTWASLTIPVTVNIARTRANYVAPYVAFAGESKEVIIRGEAFNAITPTKVRFGSVAATSFTVVSPTEIRATHPALTAGVYPVHIDNVGGFDRTTAELHVVNRPSFSTGTLDYPEGPDFLVMGMTYDAQRECLLVYGVYNQRGADTTRILRYAHGSGGWTLAASTSAAYDGAIALSIDGRKLYFAHPGSMDELDPVTLAVTRTVTDDYGRIRPHVYKLAVANDGTVIIQPDYAQFSAASLATYFSRSHTLDTVLIPGPQNTIPPTTFSSGAIGVSRDGGKLLMTHGYWQRTARYMSGTATEFVDTDAERRSFDSIELNRKGDLLLQSYYAVWDANLNKIGELPPNTTRTTVLAPEQPRIYSYDENQYDHSGTIRVFDPTLPTSGGLLAEVMPAINLPGGTPVTAPMMAISTDGSALFLAQYDQMVVLDLP